MLAILKWGFCSLRANSAVMLPTPGLGSGAAYSLASNIAWRICALQELFKKLALDLDREGKAVPLAETAFSRVGLSAWPARPAGSPKH